MRRVILGVDIDDVVYPWYDLAHDWCVRQGLLEGKPGWSGDRRPQTWAPYEEYDIEDKVWYEALAAATEDGKHLYLGHPIRGAMTALDRAWAHGFEIHLITNRGQFAHGDKIKAYTEQWVSDWLVPHDSLTFTTDKVAECQRLGVTHAIDDSMRNIAAYAAAGVNFAVQGRPWNEEFEHHWRVDSINEFVDDVVREKEES